MLARYVLGMVVLVLGMGGVDAEPEEAEGVGLMELLESVDWDEIEGASGLREVMELEGAGERGPETLAQLKELAEYPGTGVWDATTRAIAMFGLAETGSEDPESWAILKRRADGDPDSIVRLCAVMALGHALEEMRSNGEHPLEGDVEESLGIIERRVREDANLEVRKAALRGLAEGLVRVNTTETMPLMKQIALEEEQWELRKLAAEGLRWGGGEDREVFEILMQLAEGDERGEVRVAARERLTVDWRGEPAVKELCKRWVASDESIEVRDWALCVLGSFGPEDPESWMIVKQYAEDAEETIRATAVAYLSCHMKVDPEAFAIVKRRADDESWMVRQHVIHGLAMDDAPDAESIEILMRLAGTDEEAHIRESATEKLGRLCEGHAEVVWGLMWIAEEDASPGVQYEAIEQLATAPDGYPEIARLLMRLTTGTGEGHVRLKAFAMLAEGWADDPEAAAFMKERVLGDEDVSIRRKALEGWANGRELDKTDRRLMDLPGGVEFDGYDEWADWGAWEWSGPASFDPREPVTEERVAQRATELEMTEEAVRERYERLAGELGLTLEWVSGEKGVSEEE